MDKLVNWESLRNYCSELLVAQGMVAQDAFLVADSLVRADLCGIESHGVSRMSIYMRRVDEGVVNKNCHISTLGEYPGSLALDAHNSMGIVAGVRCMDKTIEKAKDSGAVFTTVRHSNHFGIAAYFTTRAAQAGMVGLAASNAPPSMAPWGSPEKYIGTNPFSIAIPTRDEPIVLDMATSVVAQGKIIMAAKTNKKIPEGWAITTDGQATTDPDEALKGTVLPMGGPKGYGIAIAIDILCGILTGAAFGPYLGNMWNDFENHQNIGHTFFAADVKKFIDYEIFLSQVELMKKEIRALPKSPFVREIYMPGEVEHTKAKQRKEEGIPVPDAVLDELIQLGQKWKVDFSL